MQISICMVMADLQWRQRGQVYVIFSCHAIWAGHGAFIGLVAERILTADCDSQNSWMNDLLAEYIAHIKGAWFSRCHVKQTAPSDIRMGGW